MVPQMIKADELKVGDVVQLFPDGYGTATVRQIADGEITFYRPYTHTGDFIYTGGVICYVGIEIVKRPTTERVSYPVFQRANLR